MDDIGCHWTVWDGHGNTAGLKTVAHASIIGPRRMWSVPP